MRSCLWKLKILLNFNCAFSFKMTVNKKVVVQKIFWKYNKQLT